MELVAPLLLLLLLLTLVWIALAAKGVDPARLLRSSFKTPTHHLTPSSYAERERLLLQKQAAPPGPRTGRTLLYSDTIATLAETRSLPEIEEILQFLLTSRLVDSDIKAQHFAQQCQRKLPLQALSPVALSVVITIFYRYVHFQVVANSVQRCFESASGLACLQLKNELERHVSIYRLVCQRLRFSSVRDAIVQHLEREAAELLKNPTFVRPVKLLCDIDDTMISVLFDTRYPDLTVYPGVHQFVEELLHCSSNNHISHTASSQDTVSNDNDNVSNHSNHSIDDNDHDDGNDTIAVDSTEDCETRSRITFLTARPEIMRRRSIRQLRASGFFHFNLLMGRLSHVVLGPRRIAAGKLENFENFRRLFAEHQFVFVGDNGQGDIDLGMDLLEHPTKYGVSVVLIHDVIRNHVRSAATLAKAGLCVEAYRRHECDMHGIHLFTTYISAIAKLYAHGLVEADAVRRVVQKTTLAHAAITYESQSQRDSATREIAIDIALVLSTMPEVQIDDLVAQLSRELRELVHLKRVVCEPLDQAQVAELA